MANATLSAALKDLRAQRDRIDKAIASLEESLDALEHSAPARGRRRKKTKAAAKAPAGGKRKRRSGGRRKRAPRGLLQETIHQVLAAAKTPLSPTALRDRVMDAGYPSTNRDSLYSSVFTKASSDPKVKKTKAGFSLRKTK